jgi:hypothetical protein
MKEKNMPKADFLTSILLIGFGIAVLVMSIQMPRLEDQKVNPYSVPGVVPGFLGAIVAFLGVILFVRSLIRQGYRLEITGRTIGDFFRHEETRRIALTIAISVVYGVVLIGRIPYELATGLYVAAFIVVFEYRWKEPLAGQGKTVALALLIGALTAAIVGLVFRYVFLVNLPG